MSLCATCKWCVAIGKQVWCDVAANPSDNKVKCKFYAVRQEVNKQEETK